MAGRSDIEAGRAFVRLSLQSGEFTKGLAKARQALQATGQAMQAIGTVAATAGAAVTAPFVAAVKVFSDLGGQLKDVSDRTGLTASSLAELKFAAEQSGASLTDVEAALRGMARRGLDVTKFDQVAAEIAAIEDPTERAAAAMEAFGKSGTNILPMLADLQSLRQEARDLGLAPTEESVGLAAALGDTFDKLKAIVEATAYNIGAALAPALLRLGEIIKNVLVSVNQFVKDNQEAIRTIAGIGAGVVAAGGALTGLGVALSALATPIGAVSAAFALAFGTVLSRSKELQGEVKTSFNTIVSDAKNSASAIADAFQGGDMQLAWDVAMAGLDLAFKETLNGMIDSAKLFADELGKIIADALNPAKKGNPKVAMALFPGLGLEKWLESKGDFAEPTAGDSPLDAIGQFLDTSDDRKRLEELRRKASQAAAAADAKSRAAALAAAGEGAVGSGVGGIGASSATGLPGLSPADVARFESAANEIALSLERQAEERGAAIREAAGPVSRGTSGAFFSASAALAAGRGGPLESIAAETKKQTKINDEQLRLQREQFEFEKANKLEFVA